MNEDPRGLADLTFKNRIEGDDEEEGRRDRLSYDSQKNDTLL